MIVILSVVCILKAHVNTNAQSNACMCEMMSKRLKEALTVLFVTHVERVESGGCGFYATLYTE